VNRRPLTPCVADRHTHLPHAAHDRCGGARGERSAALHLLLSSSSPAHLSSSRHGTPVTQPRRVCTHTAHTRTHARTHARTHTYTHTHAGTRNPPPLRALQVSGVMRVPLNVDVAVVPDPTEPNGSSMYVLIDPGAANARRPPSPNQTPCGCGAPITFAGVPAGALCLVQPQAAHHLDAAHARDRGCAPGVCRQRHHDRWAGARRGRGECRRAELKHDVLPKPTRALHEGPFLLSIRHTRILSPLSVGAPTARPPPSAGPSDLLASGERARPAPRPSVRAGRSTRRRQCHVPRRYIHGNRTHYEATRSY